VIERLKYCPGCLAHLVSLSAAKVQSLKHPWSNLSLILFQRSCNVTNVMLHQRDHMSIGNSGRIVIELEPGLKRQIYSDLARDGMTLKEWFVREAQNYITTTSQVSLDLEPSTDKSESLQIR
jgi:hypothetical protein